MRGEVRLLFWLHSKMDVAAFEPTFSVGLSRSSLAYLNRRGECGFGHGVDVARQNGVVLLGEGCVRQGIHWRRASRPS